MSESTLLAIRALQALGSWRRLEGKHFFSSGMGCACGPGFDGVPGSALELDLIEFLNGRYGKVAALQEFWIWALQEPAPGGSLAYLLQLIVDGKLPAEPATKIVSDLEKSLFSLARSHGGAS